MNWATFKPSQLPPPGPDFKAMNKLATTWCV